MIKCINGKWKTLKFGVTIFVIRGIFRIEILIKTMRWLYWILRYKNVVFLVLFDIWLIKTKLFINNTYIPLIMYNLSVYDILVDIKKDLSL